MAQSIADCHSADLTQLTVVDAEDLKLGVVNQSKQQLHVFRTELVVVQYQTLHLFELVQAFHEVKATMLGEFGVGKVKFNQLTVDSFCYDRSATANCRYIL